MSGAIKLAHDQIAKPGFFDGVNVIAFADCVVRLDEKSGLKVQPHARENRARAGYPFAYEPNALPRRFLAFLFDLFRDDTDRGEKECLVQEFYGACIIGNATRYQKALLGHGPAADNGKSTLSEMMSRCMPQGTTSSIAPQDWSHEYYRAALVGKHLNAVNELPEREIIASEAFKAIITGDPITGRIIRESPVTFRPTAGHAFFCNKLPGTSDQTDGFWRRFLVLTFNRSFQNDPARDPEMGAKLQEERPLIVSWLLEGAARLVRERSYTVPSSHAAAMAAWRKNANPIALFVDAELRALRLDESTTFGLYATELYATYKRWAESNGHRAVASNTFGSRMRDLGHEPKKTNTGWRYLLTPLTALDRARVTDSAGLVTDSTSRQTQEVSRA